MPEAIRAVIRLSACCICRSRRPLYRTNYICDSWDWERSKQTCMSSCRYGAALGRGLRGFACMVSKRYILRFESGALVSLQLSHRCQTTLTSPWLQPCEPFGPARNARVSCLLLCDERTRVNIIAISGTRKFTSCLSSDVTPPAVLSTLVPFLVEIQSTGIANAYVDSQKLDAMLREPCTYSKWPQKQSQSIQFQRTSWGSMPPGPPRAKSPTMIEFVLNI